MSNRINNLVQFENFIIDTQNKVIRYKDEPIELPLKAIEVLCLLVENKGELVTKEQILNTVWKDSFVEESVLTQNIYRLRKLFKTHDIEDEIIKNVPRRGYRFLGETSEIVEKEISIERSIIEKKLFTEIEFDKSGKEIFIDELPEKEIKKLPSKSSSSFFKSKSFLYSVLIVLVSFFAIGAGFWFWKSPNSNNSNLAFDNLEIEALTESGQAFIPAISRDNQNLAYVRNVEETYEIVLRNLSSKSETVVVSANHGLGSVNFSADGNYLFYVARDPESPESTVYQIPIYGGPKRKILTNVRNYFSISPDGNQLAYYRYDPQKAETSLMTANTDGSEEKVIASRKAPKHFEVWGISPSWSPDGKTFVVPAFEFSKEKSSNKNRNYLVEIDIETGEEKPVKHPEWEYIGKVTWLKDGKGLIVSAKQSWDKYYQFWHLSYPIGEATRITNDTNNYYQFQLSFDTKSIITTNYLQHSNLFLVSLENPKDVRQLTSQKLSNYGLRGVDWTKDGKSLVYVRSIGSSDGNLWKLDLETLESTQITFDKKIRNRLPKTTADGKSVVFSSNRSGNRHIWQIDLDGKNLKQITETKEGENNPALSADGKWLFFTKPARGSSEIWKKSFADGKSYKVLEFAGGVVGISPIDENQIVAEYYNPNEKDKTPWNVILFSTEDKDNLKPLNIILHNHTFAWKKDGTGIYYPKRAMGENNIWFYSFKNDKIQQVTNFEDQKIVNLSVSPDGKTMAVSSSVVTSNILKISNFQQN